MDSKIFNKYKISADVANLTLNKVIELCQPGTRCSQICKFGDDLMTEKLNEVYKNLNRGIALPTCLSINNVIAHNVYTENDDYILQNDDIVKIELACHIENYVSSVGDTIKIGCENYDDVIAAKIALEVALKKIEHNTPLKVFEEIIRTVGEKYDMYLVQRPNVFHEQDTTIFYDWCYRDNGKFPEQSWVVKSDEELDLEDLTIEYADHEIKKDEYFIEKEVYHLDITFSKDTKPTMVSERKPCVFQRTYRYYALKGKYAKELLKEVNKNYPKIFWRVNQINMQETRAKLGLKECLEHHTIRGLGIAEKKTSPIIRLKCSIVVQKNNIYRLTGKKYDVDLLDERLTDEFRDILKLPMNFNKRYETQTL